MKDLIPKPGNRAIQTTIEEEPDSWPYLRYAAGRHYATDVEHMCTVGDMVKLPIFSVVPLGTMVRWCAQDGWVERRRNLMEVIRKREEHVVGTALVQARLEQLKKTQNVMDKAYKMLMTKAQKRMLEANSMEGVMNAYARLCQLADEQREKLADSLFPDTMVGQTQQTQQYLPAVRPRLSVEETRAAALTIVRMRRDEIRAALRSEEEEKSGVMAPHMRVIEGEK